MAATMSRNVWTPDPGGLRTVCGMLHETTTGVDPAGVYARLQAYASRADFNNYLAYILAHGDPSLVRSVAGEGPFASSAQAADSVRQAAGLLLKNNLKHLSKNLAPEIRTYINNELLSAIGDNSRLVRSAVAVCITAVVSKAGLQVWPDLFPNLVSLLDSKQDAFLDGALNALAGICEDAPDVLDSDPSQPLNVIIPKLLDFFQHPNDAVRVKVVHILNQFLLVMPPALSHNIDSYLNALFRVAEDASPEVRGKVCSAICMLLESQPDALGKHMPNVVHYMVNVSADSSAAVALEATEFWTVLGSGGGTPESLATARSALPRLVPLLLNNMTYSEEERALFDAEEEDNCMIPDRPQDMRPGFHNPRYVKSASHGCASGVVANPGTVLGGTSASSIPIGGTNVCAAPSARWTAPATKVSRGRPSRGQVLNECHAASQVAGDANGGYSGVTGFRNTGDSDVFASGVSGQAYAGSQVLPGSSELDAGDASDDEDIDSDDASGAWSLRKGSALGLDSLSSVFGEEMLPFLLPELQRRLDSQAWYERECGILALGAIADGCYSGILPHLPALYPYLLNSMVDDHHRTRLMSCWTVARYSRWVLEQRDDAMLSATLKSLCERMLDRNKAVQRSACSALSNVHEHAGVLVVAFSPLILQSIRAAFGRYQENNVVALYDTICTLASAVGTELSKPEFVTLLMPPLLERWSSIPEDDARLVGLFGCISCVFRALGSASQQFVLPVFTRCVGVVESVYSTEGTLSPQVENTDRLTSSIDLICGLCEALGPAIDPLLIQPSNGRAHLMHLLFLAMRDQRSEVRQSSFALVGEFARKGMPSLVPVMAEYVNILVAALNPQYMKCANNATWALGEIIMMAGYLPGDVPLDRKAVRKPLVEVAIPSLVRCMNIPQLNDSLIENTALTLGRLGLIMPDALAPRLEQFVHPLLSVVHSLTTNKEQAFRGINAMIKLNPGALLKNFSLYAQAVRGWVGLSHELESEFAAILSGYKVSLGDQWPMMFASCGPDVQSSLRVRFKL